MQRRKKEDYPFSEKALQKFEKNLYDNKQLLEIAKSLYSVLDLPTLIESVLYICMCQMRVSGAAVYIHKSFDSEFFILEENYNVLRLDDRKPLFIAADHPLIQYLSKTNTIYTLDELSDLFGNSEPIRQFTDLNPSLIVPLNQKTILNGILLLGDRIEGKKDIPYNEYEKEQIATIASLAAIAVNNAALVEMTTTDIMTRLKLKHYFHKVLADKLEFSKDNELPLCLMMIDVDHFKKINDTHGHACGDLILQQIAKIIVDGIRGQDMAGRYGGEEFTVMLFDTDKQAAFKVADRIRHAVEEHFFEYHGIIIKSSISIGVSMFTPETPDMSVRDLIDQADKALYESKRQGRNRVTLYASVSERVVQENSFFSFGNGLWTRNETQ
ncbi:sensor domain-containing diguanylate cyclase [Treponema sp. OMZ 840]|uniref:diguanylate cyclase DgcA n=1 Tax=Treponema sp. OMZ 840 TaxID=244313 RepID=UPI003D8D8315